MAARWPNAPNLIGLKLQDFFPLIDTPNNCKLFLRSVGLLANGMICVCGANMEERPYSRDVEGCVWRCPMQGCLSTANIRKGSFLPGAR